MYIMCTAGETDKEKQMKGGRETILAVVWPTYYNATSDKEFSLSYFNSNLPDASPLERPVSTHYGPNWANEAQWNEPWLRVRNMSF